MLSQSQFSPNCIDFQARFYHQRAQFKILINPFLKIANNQNFLLAY